MSEFEEKNPPELLLPIPKSMNGSEGETDEEGDPVDREVVEESVEYKPMADQPQGLIDPQVNKIIMTWMEISSKVFRD